MIQFYGYKNCGTCRKAEKALQEYTREYSFIDITLTPPNAMTLKKIAEQAGIELSKLFNTSGVQYRELKIKDKLSTMNSEQILHTLAGNGRLIKRPLVTDGASSTVGFKEAVFKKTWKK